MKLCCTHVSFPLSLYLWRQCFIHWKMHECIYFFRVYFFHNWFEIWIFYEKLEIFENCVSYEIETQTWVNFFFFYLALYWRLETPKLNTRSWWCYERARWNSQWAFRKGDIYSDQTCHVNHTLLVSFPSLHFVSFVSFVFCIR